MNFYTFINVTDETRGKISLLALGMLRHWLFLQTSFCVSTEWGWKGLKDSTPQAARAWLGGGGEGAHLCPDPSSWTSEHSDGTQVRCCIAGLDLYPRVLSHCCCDIHETEWLGDHWKTLLFLLSCSSAGPVFNWAFQVNCCNLLHSYH